MTNPVSVTLINQAEKVVGSSVKILVLLAVILSALVVLTNFSSSLNF
jgi:TRAP-type mannitol/chloroaromatic compound transport system permease small subunit